MKVVYIAGPYGDAGGYLAIDRNIARAREMADWLVSHGIGYLCPHMNSAHFEAIRPDVLVGFWYEMDLLLMRGCDALMVIEGSEDSKGTAKETVEWRKTGKPIFYHYGREDLLTWAATT